MSDNQCPETSSQLIAYKPLRIVEARVPPALDRASNMDGDAPLATFWYVLIKRRWTIIAAATVLTAIAAVLSFRMTPIYEATARLEIEPETPLLQASSDGYEKVDADEVFLQTQIQVLKSESLAWQTIEQLKLASHLDGLSADKAATGEYDKRKVQLIAAFKSGLKVEQVPKTRMLSVSFQDADPQLAAQVATSLVNGYLEYNFRHKDESIRRSGWMEQQVEELKANVEKSQQALVSYDQQNQIVNSGDRQNVLEQMLGDQSHDLTGAMSERIQKQALYRQVLANRAQLASLVHDQLLENLEEKAADLKQQYTQTVAQYGPNFPNAKRLQLQINENKDQIRGEQERIINRIGSDYNAAYNREKLAVAGVARQKEEVGRMNQLLVRDNILRHEFESSQQLYQNLLQRLKDATVSAALRSTNIHMVDSALPPNTPVRPHKLLNIVSAFWAGLIVGVIGAFAQEALDSSIKTAEEAEALILTPALGVIPFERGSWLKAWKPKGLESSQLAMSLTKHPNSSLSEAFRALGTAFSVPSRPVKTLLITSAQNGEGKTTTALNLSQALAQRKVSVLLMDCDFRKGEVAKAIGLKNDKGLTAVLCGEMDVSDALLAVQPNLSVLAAGAVPANPVAMLASREMVTLLETVAARFDFVIIDSPPVLAVTDAAILSGLVDGVLLVAASGTTPRGGLVRTRSVLEASGAKILGLAVNKLDPRRPGHGYSDSTYAYK